MNCAKKMPVNADTEDTLVCTEDGRCLRCGLRIDWSGLMPRAQDARR